VTDIEGNHDYWCRFIANSRVICGTPGDIDFRDSKGHLVFGGDICDRGPGLFPHFLDSFRCFFSFILTHLHR